MFLDNNSIYPIGLDISDSSLKLVQLKRLRDKIKIQAVGRTALKDGLFSQGEVIDKEEVVKAIKNLVQNPFFGKVSSAEVVACLPETKTFIKLIEVERSPNDLENMIEAEIEKHVPMAINEIYYDWEVVRKSREKLYILIGAASKKIVDQYSSLLEESGLSVIALEIEPVAICRSLLEEESMRYKGASDKNYVIIDFGAVRTSLTVYSKNTILFTVSMDISGEGITKDIARMLGIDMVQAEKAKIICGLDESQAQGVVKDILADVVTALTKKINETIEFFGKHFPDRGPIDRILLCGGGANIKNIREVIAGTTGIGTSIADALINLDEKKEDFSRIAGGLQYESLGRAKPKAGAVGADHDADATFATSLGLALRGLFLDE